MLTNELGGEDIAVRECKKRIRELRVALNLAWSALDGIEDARQRSELKYEIIDILRG